MMYTDKNTGNQVKGAAALFLAAFIWGIAFVAQRVGMDYVGPFTFNAVRNLLGAVTLLPFIFLRRSAQREGEKDKEGEKNVRAFPWKGGAVCGFLLFIAANFQQVGLQYTTVGKAGFITALYIVAVPVLGIFLKKRVGLRIWISVILAVTGLYLLCMTQQLAINGGDILELICAVAFAFQILAVDHYVRFTDGVMLACGEFAVCGLLSTIPMFLTEQVSLSSIWAARIPIFYAGVFSSGIAYTMQIIGQKELNPTVASLIMSLESVISAIAGWLILGQKMSARELCGCIVMFAAIILAQLPEKAGG